eukprot:4010375-Prymnesium_polylepis.1
MARVSTTALAQTHAVTVKLCGGKRLGAAALSRGRRLAWISSTSSRADTARQYAALPSSVRSSVGDHEHTLSKLPGSSLSQRAQCDARPRRRSCSSSSMTTIVSVHSPSSTRGKTAASSGERHAIAEESRDSAGMETTCSPDLMLRALARPRPPQVGQSARRTPLSVQPNARATSSTASL